VVHICNPSYSGGGEPEYLGSRPTEAKVVRHGGMCLSSQLYGRVLGRRIMVHADWAKKKKMQDPS
jgi:hypothetical protein